MSYEDQLIREATGQNRDFELPEPEETNESNETGDRPKSKRKPHNQDAGYICELIFKPSHSHIVIYRAKEQNIEQDEKYLVVCSKHGSNLAETNIPSARKSMKFPAFCEECMQTEDNACETEVNHFLKSTSQT